MSDDENTGYILVQIDMEYGALSQGFFTRAPAHWTDMSEEAREAFLENAAADYLTEQVSSPATYFATAKEAREVNSSGWGPQFHEDDVEDIFG